MTTRFTNILIREGGVDDYLALSHHHYHPEPPATTARVLIASERGSHQLLGVLTVSMPVLNASWREVTFPGRYRTSDRRADAKLLNTEVRTISRVIVDPRFRGLGIGTRLVRSYLHAPLTAVTEALAAMGAFSRFFQAAGMIALPPIHAPRDLRLMDALASLRIAPWMLAAPKLIPDDKLISPLLSRELRRWAQGSRATRRLVGAPNSEVLRRAAGIFHPPAAFIAVRRRARVA